MLSDEDGYREDDQGRYGSKPRDRAANSIHANEEADEEVSDMQGYDEETVDSPVLNNSAQRDGSGDRIMEKKRSVATPFITKVYSMLETSALNNLIVWTGNAPSGNPSPDSFSVLNQQRFCSEVAPQYFKHSNWQSFVRQLNMYGFHKVNESFGSPAAISWEFHHPYFQKGRPDLFINIKRKSSRGSSSHGPLRGGGEGAAHGGFSSSMLRTIRKPLSFTPVSRLSMDRSHSLDSSKTFPRVEDGEHSPVQRERKDFYGKSSSLQPFKDDFDSHTLSSGAHTATLLGLEHEQASSYDIHEQDSHDGRGSISRQPGEYRSPTLPLSPGPFSHSVAAASESLRYLRQQHYTRSEGDGGDAEGKDRIARDLLSLDLRIRAISEVQQEALKEAALTRTVVYEVLKEHFVGSRVHNSSEQALGESSRLLLERLNPDLHFAPFTESTSFRAKQPDFLPHRPAYNQVPRQAQPQSAGIDTGSSSPVSQSRPPLVHQDRYQQQQHRISASSSLSTSVLAGTGDDRDRRFEEGDRWRGRNMKRDRDEDTAQYMRSNASSYDDSRVNRASPVPSSLTLSSSSQWTIQPRQLQQFSLRPPPRHQQNALHLDDAATASSLASAAPPPLAPASNSPSLLLSLPRLSSFSSRPSSPNFTLPPPSNIYSSAAHPSEFIPSGGGYPTPPEPTTTPRSQPEPQFWSNGSNTSVVLKGQSQKGGMNLIRTSRDGLPIGSGGLPPFAAILGEDRVQADRMG